MQKFKDRVDAGKKLAERLMKKGFAKNSIVMALPRGGIPVGLEISRELNLPFDIFLVRKLGVPGHEELAMGAVAYGNGVVLNEDIINWLNIESGMVKNEIIREREELRRRNQLYRHGEKAPSARGRGVILVDDGMATGATMRAAVAALRKQDPSSISVALPVAPVTVYETLTEADRIICLQTPEPFYSVGLHYEDFSQLNDENVKALLNLGPKEGLRSYA